MLLAKMGPKLLLLIVFAGAMAAVAEKEHVHFKIHVPEIIKHHMHTHTIFIHVHHPSKKKEPSHSHNEHEDLNIYNTYTQHTGYGGEYEVGEGDENIDKNRLTTQYPSLVTYRNNHADSSVPFYDDFINDDSRYKNNPNALETESGAITGYGYSPQYVNSNYQVTENVDEGSGSHEKKNYEKSHKSGGKITHDHVYKDKMKNFYDNKIEGSSESKLYESSEENRRFPRK